jgi:hypothetical protein
MMEHGILKTTEEAMGKVAERIVERLRADRG